MSGAGSTASAFRRACRGPGGSSFKIRISCLFVGGVNNYSVGFRFEWRSAKFFPGSTAALLRLAALD